MKSTSIIPLNRALLGCNYSVVSIRVNKKDRRRILDLGLIPNTVIKVLQKSPSGDPVAYFIRGTVIALRSECTKQIIVEKI